jgi:hypothetical protein
MPIFDKFPYSLRSQGDKFVQKGCAHISTKGGKLLYEIHTSSLPQLLSQFNNS